MNKSTMLLLGVISVLSTKFGGAFDALRGARNRYSAGPQGIPHGNHRHQPKPHAPNDGHWHMKFHRSRR